MTGARFHSQIMSKWSWKIDVNGKRKTNKECPKFSLNQKFLFFAGYWPITDVFFAGYWPVSVLSSKVPMTGAKLLCVTEINEKCSKSSPNQFPMAKDLLDVMDANGWLVSTRGLVQQNKNRRRVEWYSLLKDKRFKRSITWTLGKKCNDVLNQNEWRYKYFPWSDLYHKNL